MDSNKILFYGLATLVAVLGAVGDGFFTNWARKGILSHLVVGWILCNIALGFLAYALKKGTLLESMIIYSVVGDLIIILLSVCYFKERISPMGYFGAVVAIIGVVMMEMSNK